MKFICDKCGFCRESDENHKSIWIGTKEKNSDGFEWQHCCYECGKEMINLIEANCSKIERKGDEDE